MCLFSIKFEGRTYNKAATLLLLKYQRDEIERLETLVENSKMVIAEARAKYNSEVANRRKAEAELDTTRRIARNYKAQIDKLTEELNDFPARNKSGKYTKRAKSETKNQNKE